MKNNKLQSLASELDNHLTGVYASGESLNDIKTILGHLREDMGSTKEEDIRYSFKEFHLKVRVLDDLMTYTMKEFNEIHYKANAVKDEIFYGVRAGVIEDE